MLNPTQEQTLELIDMLATLVNDDILFNEEHNIDQGDSIETTKARMSLISSLVALQTNSPINAEDFENLQEFLEIFLPTIS